MNPILWFILVSALSSLGLKDADTGSIDLVFAGDAMMHQAQLDVASRGGNRYDFSEYYSALRPYIESADYAVVNLELPLGSDDFSGYPRFCAPYSFLDPLADAGFDLFLNANNHILDRNDEGLRHTLAELNRRSLRHVGAYNDRNERDSIPPLIENIGGFKIAFLNYTYGTNGLTARKGAVVDYIDRNLIASDITAARNKGAELICVCIHWGEEYELLPVKSQREMANFLTEQGVDLIIGSHPHVIQPMEMRRSKTHNKDVFLCYSLGNFISNMLRTDTRGGAMARIRIKRDADGTPRIDDASYRMVFTMPPGGSSESFRLVDGETPTESYIENKRRDFVNNARNIFDRHNINVRRDTASIASYASTSKKFFLPGR